MIIDAWDPCVYLDGERNTEDAFTLNYAEIIFKHTEEWMSYVLEQLDWFDIDQYLICQHADAGPNRGDQRVLDNQVITHPSLLKFLEDKKHEFVFHNWDQIYSRLKGKKVLMCGQSYSSCVLDRPLGLKMISTIADVYTTPFLVSGETGYAFHGLEDDGFYYSPGPGLTSHWRFKWKNLNNYLYRLVQVSYKIKETEQ